MLVEDPEDAPRVTGFLPDICNQVPECNAGCVSLNTVEACPHFEGCGTLAIGPAAILSRIIRVEMVAVLEADFVRTARAKRLPDRTIYLRHALPNALTASLTLGGLILGALVAGTVLIESVFAWPGLGSTIVSSILNKDYQVVQAIVLVYGAGVLLINTMVDVALALLDPRSMIRED